jgi:hypothetical protein
MSFSCSRLDLMDDFIFSMPRRLGACVLIYFDQFSLKPVRTEDADLLHWERES